MPWPIPELIPVDYPKPLSMRAWVPTLLVIATGTAGAVLLLWPGGMSTHSFTFWLLLIGVPVVACSFIFGLRLDRWESERVTAEESEREQQRLMSLWHDWCHRHVRIHEAAAFLPVKPDAAQIGAADADLPTNTNRALHFTWSDDPSDTTRHIALLERVASWFAMQLQQIREITVTFMVDEDSLRRTNTWQTDALRIFERVAPQTMFDVRITALSDCGEWFAQSVDVVDLPAQLVVAAQIWPEEEGVRIFSEGAAALLIGPRDTDKRGPEKEAAVAHEGFVFRPMRVDAEAFDRDVRQLLSMQLAPALPRYLWSTRSDRKFTGMAIDAHKKAQTADGGQASKTGPTERWIDGVTGLPGPASNWIALATALEAAATHPGFHLVLWSEPARKTEYAGGETADAGDKSGDPLWLCAVSAEQQTEEI